MENNYFSKKVTYYTFILCIFVVFTHALNIKTYNLLYNMGKSGVVVYWIETYLYNIFTVAVPGFFLVSGYLFYRNFKISNFKVKLKKRISSLLIPFIIWNSVGFLFFTTIYSIPYISNRMNGDKVVFSFNNYINSVWNSTYSALWFVRVLMTMVIIAPIIFIIIRKKYIGIITIIALLIINFIWPTNEFSLVYSSIFYLTGALAAVHFKSKVEVKSNKYFSIICSVLFLILSIVFTLTGATEIHRIRAIVLLIFSILSWFAFDNIKEIKEPKWYMKMSFFIYCLHYIILESIEKVWLLIFKNTVIGAATDFIFAPIITISIIISLGYLLKLHCNKIYKVLTGNRG